MSRIVPRLSKRSAEAWVAPRFTSSHTRCCRRSRFMPPPTNRATSSGTPTGLRSSMVQCAGIWRATTCSAASVRNRSRLHLAAAPRTAMTARPERTEAAPYYFTYIDQVPDGDVCAIMRAQASDVVGWAGGITEEMSGRRYAADKWSIREVLGHINDCERLFVMRAFWFARGFDTPLPSFDQHVAMSAAGAHERTWQSHVDEFAAQRAATVAFFESVPEAAWSRRGIASDNPFTVRALAYMVPGHVRHHLDIIRERYL